MGRLQNNPSIAWVHPTSTNARPLAWANKKMNDHERTNQTFPMNWENIVYNYERIKRFVVRRLHCSFTSDERRFSFTDCRCYQRATSIISSFVVIQTRISTHAWAVSSSLQSGKHRREHEENEGIEAREKEWGKKTTWWPLMSL
jgi:hypothetical protein